MCGKLPGALLKFQDNHFISRVVNLQTNQCVWVIPSTSQGQSTGSVPTLSHPVERTTHYFPLSKARGRDESLLSLTTLMCSSVILYEVHTVDVLKGA